jgi:hypothetical protein
LAWQHLSRSEPAVLHLELELKIDFWIRGDGNE